MEAVRSAPDGQTSSLEGMHMAKPPHKSRKNRPRRRRQLDEADERDMEAEILEAMQKADVPPEFAYAYKKTGLLGLLEDKSLWPPEHIKEWNDAVDEYRAIQARPDKPKDWNTRSQSC
jgi:hypothetical protein